jgi:hypothetical protein
MDSIRRIIACAVFVVLSGLMVSEPLFCAENSGEIGLKRDTYYDLGVTTTHSEYKAVGPFVTGFTTGIVVPFNTGAGASFAYQSFNTTGGAGILGGIVMFGLTLWGGHALMKQYPTPNPDRQMPPLDGQYRASYNRGYNQRIVDLQTRNYIFGVILGAAFEIYFIHQAMKDFHGFWGV